ncbi:hypothetical protein JOQ06_021180, partial [Pogonophryne albipinna]
MPVESHILLYRSFVTRDAHHARGIPFPHALSEMDDFSLYSIGLSRCLSVSITRNTVRLSGSLSAETAVILAARSSSSDHALSQISMIPGEWVCWAAEQQ